MKERPAGFERSLVVTDVVGIQLDAHKQCDSAGK